MPARVRRARGRWAIVNAITGRVYGYSTTKKRAQASARIRNQAKKKGRR